MIRDDSRAHRFAKTWLRLSLATLVGIGSTVELAAMPIPAGVQLHGPTLIQQSPGPPRQAQQPAAPPRPPSADESKPDSFIELHEALTAARERLGDLSRAAKAVAATGQLRQELAALREENQQMRAAIEAARAERSDLETEKQAAEAHAAELLKTVEEATDERDELRARLAEADARLGPSEAAKAELENEVAKLREAARTAAADTRQLIEALAAIGLAAGPLEADAALLAESGMPSADEPAVRATRAAAAVENVAALPAPSQDSEPTSARADLPQTNTASVTRSEEGTHLDQRGILGGRPAVFSMLTDLPPERRQRVQGLLADLPSKLEERGLMTTVPGELLFAVGSDEVRTGAYQTLAKAAELIDMYNNRQVLIIGHSDAMGDAARNNELSERRAERVKQIFVDYFKIAPDRLSTEGMGDALPIASNATPEGRRANRRVEILILN